MGFQNVRLKAKPPLLISPNKGVKRPLQTLVPYYHTPIEHPFAGLNTSIGGSKTVLYGQLRHTKLTRKFTRVLSDKRPSKRKHKDFDVRKFEKKYDRFNGDCPFQHLNYKTQQWELTWLSDIVEAHLKEDFNPDEEQDRAERSELLRMIAAANERRRLEDEAEERTLNTIEMTDAPPPEWPDACLAGYDPQAYQEEWLETLDNLKHVPQPDWSAKMKRGFPLWFVLRCRGYCHTSPFADFVLPTQPTYWRPVLGSEQGELFTPLVDECPQGTDSSPVSNASFDNSFNSDDDSTLLTTPSITFSNDSTINFEDTPTKVKSQTSAFQAVPVLPVVVETPPPQQAAVETSSEATTTVATDAAETLPADTTPIESPSADGIQRNKDGLTQDQVYAKFYDTLNDEERPMIDASSSWFYSARKDFKDLPKWYQDVDDNPKDTLRNLLDLSQHPPRCSLQPQFASPEATDADYKPPFLGRQRSQEVRRKFSNLIRQEPEVFEATLGTMLQEGVTMKSLLKDCDATLVRKMLGPAEWHIDYWRLDCLNLHFVHDVELQEDEKKWLQFHKAPSGGEKTYQETFHYLKSNPEIEHVFRVVLAGWLEDPKNRESFRGIARKAGWCDGRIYDGV